MQLPLGLCPQGLPRPSTRLGGAEGAPHPCGAAQVWWGLCAVVEGTMSSYPPLMPQGGMLLGRFYSVAK